MKISVLTPSYNSGRYLQRAIDSVVMQNHDDWEHIVIDGGSKDNTCDILKLNPTVKWVSEADRGQSDAMNKAFRKCTGDIIVYLNADDEFLPGTFGAVVSRFREEPTADAVIGNLRYCDNERDIIKYPKLTLDDILHFQNFKFPANPVSYFYTREVQAKIGLFPINNHFTMDYWFLLRMYDQFKLSYLDRVFGIFHGDEINKSSDVDRALRELKKEKIKFIFERLKFKYFPVAFRDLLLHIKDKEYARNQNIL